MSADLTILDLFSAACGGWSLGMHRAGFKTIAACEWIAWRRALYADAAEEDGLDELASDIRAALANPAIAPPQHCYAES